MSKKTILTGIINPFSDQFLETWQIWKDFRSEYDKFKYKGVYSEQMALKNYPNYQTGKKK